MLTSRKKTSQTETKDTPQNNYSGKEFKERKPAASRKRQFFCRVNMQNLHDKPTQSGKTSKFNIKGNIAWPYINKMTGKLFITRALAISTATCMFVWILATSD